MFSEGQVFTFTLVSIIFFTNVAELEPTHASNVVAPRNFLYQFSTFWACFKQFFLSKPQKFFICFLKLAWTIMPLFFTTGTIFFITNFTVKLT